VKHDDDSFMIFMTTTTFALRIPHHNNNTVSSSIINIEYHLSKNWSRSQLKIDDRMVQAAYLIILFHFFSNSFGCCQGFIIPPKSNILHQQSLDKTQHLLISHSASYQNQCPFPHQTQHRPTLKLQLIPFPDLEITEATTTFISEASGESWRQYVPLIVISGISGFYVLTSIWIVLGFVLIISSASFNNFRCPTRYRSRKSACKFSTFANEKSYIGWWKWWCR